MPLWLAPTVFIEDFSFMRVLVTGTRAPASMDIMRSLIEQGHKVYSADSLTFPIGRFVKGIEKHLQFPAPKKDIKSFIQILKQLIVNNQIDLLIPTCEEIFYISQGYEDLSKHTRLFCEPFAKLNRLHDKYNFNDMVQQFGLTAPESWLLQVDEDKSRIPKGEDIVLKPLFSRFGTHLVLKPTLQAIQDLELKMPYLAQKFIEGKEYCSYAIADKGKLLIQTCYHPKYLSGPAAGIYFEPEIVQQITEFNEVFCHKTHFSGQISFDFILREGKAYVLECNPRMTSGFHFIANQINWADILEGKEQAYSQPNKPYMLGMGMFMYGYKYFCVDPQQFIKDYRRAYNVLNAFPLIGLKSLITLANLLGRMLRDGKTFHQASTADIEFNG
jgi:predicted ATP-grasp superfamily ATP-dependent carboligase